MNDWLFDLGNTRLKYAPLDAPTHFRHLQGDEFSALPAEVRGECAWVASVAPPPQRMQLLQALAPRFARISFARSAARWGRLHLAYAEPQRLGVDRFLALLAATQEEAAMLVVGVGTAMTLDFVDSQGRHRGGHIAPSPTLMRESLHARVPQLPLSGGEHVDFARDTADALASGCEGAALGLIALAAERAAHVLATTPSLIVHGGGVLPLLPHLPGACHRPALVLEGLAAWAGAEHDEDANG